MKIVKTSVSIIQNICFATLKEFEDYIIVTYPLDCEISIKDKFIHIRKKKEN
ncbi:unnamed protein product [marine sediment metagenome]|uniref:Uncharacterized protein n=1 Tax=marine sediment metagenome TaxID=412755 RepID=X1HFR1_9ZZZZ